MISAGDNNLHGSSVTKPFSPSSAAPEDVLDLRKSIPTPPPMDDELLKTSPTLQKQA
jgi:hypothetical protein